MTQDLDIAPPGRAADVLDEQQIRDAIDRLAEPAADRLSRVSVELCSVMADADWAGVSIARYFPRGSESRRGVGDKLAEAVVLRRLIMSLEDAERETRRELLGRIAAGPGPVGIRPAAA